MAASNSTSGPGTGPTVSSLDLAENITNLRWVENDFIFFVDIPCTIFNEHQLMLPSRAFPSTTIAHPHAAVSLHALTTAVLEDLMDVTISDQVLLCKPQDTAALQVISGDSLSRLIVPWARKMYASRNDNHEAFARAGKRVTETLITAIAAVEEGIFRKIHSFIDHHAPELEALYALVNFLSSLGRCVRAVWGDDSARAKLEGDTLMYRRSFDIFQQKLLELWGAHFLLAGHLGGGLPFLSYVLSCEPPRKMVPKVDTKKYETRHTTADCTCEFVRPPATDVYDLLKKGQLPVVSFDGSKLSVCGATPYSYVSISHVWADGVGSNTEKGLPLCQVRRISEHAHALNAGGWFWMDSLCIPSDEKMRTEAVRLMGKTYREAGQVVVFDSDVRTFCARASPVEDHILRIATSGWMRRVWTLQEGMFARELWFEHADGLVDCTAFNGPAYEVALHSIPLLAHRTRDDGARRFERVMPVVPTCTLNDVVGLIRYRAISRPEDEPVAISDMLGVPSAALVDFPTRDERMRALLLHLRTFHRTTILNGWWCERLALKNFRWAPATLTQVLWPDDPKDTRLVTCTPEGAFAEFSIVRFPPVELGINYGVVVFIIDDDDTEDEDTLKTKLKTVKPESCRIFHLTLSPYLFRQPNAETQRLVINAVLLGRSLDTHKLDGGGVAAVFADVAEGNKTSESPLHCRFVTIGSATDGLPDIAESQHSRTYWAHVAGREIVYGKVRVT
ncbi:hypothetical protein PYCCODRAFT_1459075 [Trametes coccinea BRFM310]|uniref:Heterokaryon incompatibility domain-containing protein n=1 Tax=Trametes coccinea (strain BRFM310) TaxID=1353009 RepID=A0A1Y2IMN9_TRAC3|nr:hypothetical protein PYCCODRAFT_1459075 [Trametes coccinea BRFM310]